MFLFEEYQSVQRIYWPISFMRYIFICSDLFIYVYLFIMTSYM